MRSWLFGLYVDHKMVDKAEEQLAAIKTLNKGFVMDDAKVVKYADALMCEGQFEKGLEVLKGHEVKGVEFVERSCFRMLDNLARSGHSIRLNETLNVLLKRGYCDVKSVFLGPLIRVNLVQGDLAMAVKDFCMFSESYKVLPLKQELMLHLLKRDGAEYVEMLRDVYSSVEGVVGKPVADSNLLVAAAQCDRLACISEFFDVSWVGFVFASWS